MKRTEYYFENLWKEKDADIMLERFFEQICPDFTEEGKSFLKKSIQGIPCFHDLGKINSSFQVEIMKNKIIQKNDTFSCIGSRHALLSAVFYLDYFLTGLRKEVSNRDDKKVLRHILVLNAYVIARHHSDLNDYQTFLKSMEEDAGKELIEILAAGKCKEYCHELLQLKSELKKVINESEDFVCIIKLMNDNVFGEEVLGQGDTANAEVLIL